MPSIIKLDMEFSLVIELKLVVDTSYFVGLTPVGNESRHAMNSNNSAQKKTHLIFHRRKNCEYQNSFTLSFTASCLCLEPCLNSVNK